MEDKPYKVLTGSAVEAIWLFFVSVCLLMLGSSNIIASKFVINEGAQQDAILRDFKQALFGWIDRFEFADRLVTFGFWMVIGTMSYILVWIIFTVVNDLISDVELGVTLIKPNDFDSNAHWSMTAGSFIFRVSSLIAVLIYLSFFIAVILPDLTQVFSRVLLGFSWLALLKSLLAVIMLALSMHIFIVLMRLFALRVRLVIR